MKAFLLKVDDAQYIQWQAKAKSAHVSMSEWIRMRCNGETTLSAAPNNQTTVLQVDRENPAALAVEAQLIKQAKEFYTEPVIKKIIGEDRKPCKHGLLFCKKCA